MIKRNYPISSKVLLFGSITVIGLAGLSTVSRIVFGQEIPNFLTITPTPIVTGSKEDDPDLTTLKEVASKKMGEYPELIKEGYKQFEVGNVKVVDNWASLNLLSYPENLPKDAHVVVPDLYLALAEKTDKETWTVYIENEPGYSEKLQQTPDILFSKRVKGGLLSKYQAHLSTGGQMLLLTRTSDEYHVPGLPYAAGEAWRYTNGPHDGYGDNTALDFATPSGTSATVRAAEDGFVVEAKETCLRVRRYNSNFEILYQHINTSDIANWEINDEIDLGGAVGNTGGTVYGCGGPSSGHHVHIEMLYPNLEGKSYNGWVVNGNNLVKEGTTKYPNGSDAVLHDNWVVAKGSDYIISFPGEAQIPRNVIVKNDSVLEVGSNARLNIDFINYKLEVENGSGVKVKNGGGI